MYAGNADLCENEIRTTHSGLVSVIPPAAGPLPRSARVLLKNKFAFFLSFFPSAQPRWVRPRSSVFRARASACAVCHSQGSSSAHVDPLLRLHMCARLLLFGPRGGEGRALLTTVQYGGGPGVQRNSKMFVERTELHKRRRRSRFPKQNVPFCSARNNKKKLLNFHLPVSHIHGT